MSSNRQPQRSNQRGDRNKKRKFKKIKKSPPKKIDWKTYIPPGGTKWHELRRIEREGQETEYLKKIRLARNLCGEIEDKYLPKKLISVNLNECPADVVETLGWQFDEDTKKFFHNEYGSKSFDVGYCVWNGDKYIVPLSDNKKDEKGLAFRYNIMTGGSMCDVYINKKSDFWVTRRGKRYAKYIQYRKSREEKKLQYKKNININHESK